MKLKCTTLQVPSLKSVKMLCENEFLFMPCQLRAAVQKTEKIVSESSLLEASSTATWNLINTNWIKTYYKETHGDHLIS